MRSTSVHITNLKNHSHAVPQNGYITIYSTIPLMIIHFVSTWFSTLPLQTIVQQNSLIVFLCIEDVTSVGADSQHETARSKYFYFKNLKTYILLNCWWKYKLIYNLFVKVDGFPKRTSKRSLNFCQLHEVKVIAHWLGFFCVVFFVFHWLF